MQNPKALHIDPNSLSRIGDVIGPYVLGELIGVGGMGVVYSATQRLLDRIVAIKMLRPDLVGDPQVRSRFRSEALAGSRIDHRNVVRVLDFGDASGAPYLVMEHVVGPRLGKLLVDHGPIPCAKALDLVRQIVAGLEDVHAKGIVHADVKTDNILVETLRDGTLVPRLIDFGIARFTATDEVCSVDQMVSGTPEYLAPEVICGGTPTFASDVYAIGVVLYELVTGATPFAGGDSAKIMTRKLEADAVPMSWRCPELNIAASLEDVVACALARDPVARFANASALGKALDEVIRTGSANMPSAGVPAVTPMSREETTMPICLDSTRQRAAVRAYKAECSPIAKCRAAVILAMATTEIDAIAIAYLDLVRALIDEHQLASAVTELEEGVELLTRPDGSGPVWRLLLTLAALHDGNGDRPRARAVAHAARDRATSACSPIGIERADALCSRLARRRSSTRRSSPW